MYKLPEDENILYSFLNTQLRDSYPSLDSFCEDKDIDKAELLKKLYAAGFSYDEERNKIV